MDFNFENDISLENEMVLLRPVQLEDISNLLPVATADKMLLKYSPRQIYKKKLLSEYIENALRSG